MSNQTPLIPIRPPPADSRGGLNYRYNQPGPVQPPQTPQTPQIRSYSTSHVGPSGGQNPQILGQMANTPLTKPNAPFPSQTNPQTGPGDRTTQSNWYQGQQGQANQVPTKSPNRPLQLPLQSGGSQYPDGQVPNYYSNRPPQSNNSPNNPNGQGFFNTPSNGGSYAQKDSQMQNNPLGNQPSPTLGRANMSMPGPTDNPLLRGPNLALSRQNSQSRPIPNALNHETRSQLNMTVGTRPEINDNLSYHSKLSTNSRNHPLRAVSVNNDEHFSTLVSREEDVKNNNLIVVRNYTQNIESTKRNVLRNMSDNYKSKVGEIWSSYLTDQLKSGPQKIDVPSLNKDVDLIKGVFYDYLMLKTELFVEELKNKRLKDVFADIDSTHNQRRYMDDRVQSLVEGDYAAVEGKNKELKAKLAEEKNNYKRMVDGTIAKYKKLREDHMGMYDREFTFKLNGDQNLVKNTLKNAIPFLNEEVNKSAAKLTKVQSLGGPGVAETLRRQIETLENELKFVKKT